MARKYGKNRSKNSLPQIPNNTWLMVSHALPCWVHNFSEIPCTGCAFPLPFHKLLKCGALIGVRNLVLELISALAAAVACEPQYNSITIWRPRGEYLSWMRSAWYYAIFFWPCSTLVYSPLVGSPGLYFTPRLASPLVLIVDFRFIICIVSLLSRDSAFRTATGYRLHGRGVGVRVPVQQDSSLLHVFHTGPVAHPANGYEGTLSPGVKQPKREADYAPPTSAKVKNTSIHTSSWFNV
jgi:hypothetical protein